MTPSTATQRDRKSSAPSAVQSSRGRDRPAAVAAARGVRANLALGALGPAAALFVLARLPDSWRVTPHASHQILMFGQKVSYPAANLDAVVIVFLAVLG